MANGSPNSSNLIQRGESSSFTQPLPAVQTPDQNLTPQSFNPEARRVSITEPARYAAASNDSIRRSVTERASQERSLGLNGIGSRPNSGNLSAVSGGIGSRFAGPTPGYEFGASFGGQVGSNPPYANSNYTPAGNQNSFRSTNLQPQDGSSFYDYSMRRHSLTGAGHSPPRQPNLTSALSHSPSLKRKSSNEDDGNETPYNYLPHSTYPTSQHSNSLPYDKRRGSSYDKTVTEQSRRDPLLNLASLAGNSSNSNNWEEERRGQASYSSSSAPGLEAKSFYLPSNHRGFNGRPQSGPPPFAPPSPFPPPPLVRHQTHDPSMNYDQIRDGLYGRGSTTSTQPSQISSSDTYASLPPASAAWARAGPLPINSQPIPLALDPSSAYGTTGGNKETPYSRSPELRISHKLAERKRRKEMAQLFDELRDALPVDRGLKSSKWEILTKAVEYIGNLKQHHAHLSNDNTMLRTHFGLPILTLPNLENSASDKQASNGTGGNTGNSGDGNGDLDEDD